MRLKGPRRRNTPARQRSRAFRLLEEVLDLSLRALGITLNLVHLPLGLERLVPVRRPAASFTLPLALSSAASALSWPLLFLPTRSSFVALPVLA